MRLVFIAAAVAALAVPALAQDLPVYPTAPTTMDVVMHVLAERLNTCSALKRRKILHSMTAQAHCIFDGYVQALANAGWPELDFEQERVQVEFVVGEKIDKKHWSFAEAGLYEAKEYSRIDAEYQAKLDALQRDIAQQQADDAQRRPQSDATTQAAIAEAEIEARVRQEELEDQRLRAATQLLTPPPPSPWPAWAQPPAPPVNTQCRVFNGVMNCTSQ